MQRLRLTSNVSSTEERNRRPTVIAMNISNMASNISKDVHTKIGMANVIKHPKASELEENLSKVCDVLEEMKANKTVEKDDFVDKTLKDYKHCDIGASMNNAKPCTCEKCKPSEGKSRKRTISSSSESSGDDVFLNNTSDDHDFGGGSGGVRNVAETPVTRIQNWSYSEYFERVTRPYLLRMRREMEEREARNAVKDEEEDLNRIFYSVSGDEAEKNDFGCQDPRHSVENGDCECKKDSSLEVNEIASETHEDDPEIDTTVEMIELDSSDDSSSETIVLSSDDAGDRTREVIEINSSPVIVLSEPESPDSPEVVMVEPDMVDIGNYETEEESSFADVTGASAVDMREEEAKDAQKIDDLLDRARTMLEFPEAYTLREVQAMKIELMDLSSDDADYSDKEYMVYQILNRVIDAISQDSALSSAGRRSLSRRGNRRCEQR